MVHCSILSKKGTSPNWFQTPSERGNGSLAAAAKEAWSEALGFKPLQSGAMVHWRDTVAGPAGSSWFQTPSERGNGSLYLHSKLPLEKVTCFKPLQSGAMVHC